jgi:hypothetical protein
MILCATAEGTTCSLIVMNNDKKQMDKQWHVIMVTTSKVILFYVGISELEKKSPFYIWTAHVLSSAFSKLLLGNIHCHWGPNTYSQTWWLIIKFWTLNRGSVSYILWFIS